MTDTVIGTFAEWDQVERAVRALSENGFTAEEISIIASEGVSQHVSAEVSEDQKEIVTESAAAGAAVGAVAGLGIALTALAVPLVGPVLVAGPLLAAALSVGAGAGAGGLLGILVGNGWSQDRAREAHGAIERGEILVAVQAGERGAFAANLLARAGATETYHEETAATADTTSPVVSDTRAEVIDRPREMPEGLVTASGAHVDPLQLPGVAGERARQIEAAQGVRIPVETDANRTEATIPVVPVGASPLRSSADIAAQSAMEEDEELDRMPSRSLGV